MAISGTKIGGTYHIYGLCKAYVRGYPLQNMALYGTVPPFLDPGIPIDKPHTYFPLDPFGSLWSFNIAMVNGPSISMIYRDLPV